jgi:hypothetical protein
MVASQMAINVTDYKLVDGSFNGNSETNIMGYWITPLMGPDRGTLQSDIWKLRAATANINLTSHSGSSVIKGLQASVQHSFALLAGSINISKSGTIFDISGSNCNLTSCVDNYINDSLLIVNQSPSILVPTNFTGHGSMIEDYIFFDYVKEIKSLSVREKRFVGLLIAGIVAAITAIATMTTAEVALSQSIQNAHYILTGKM